MGMALGMEKTGSTSKGLRVVALSGISGFTAPLVFLGVIVLRKSQRRVTARYRHWNRRFQHEIARWT